MSSSCSIFVQACPKNALEATQARAQLDSHKLAIPEMNSLSGP